MNELLPVTKTSISLMSSHCLSKLHAKRFFGILATTLFMAASSSYAQSQFEEASGDEDKTWQDMAVELPPLPTPTNLLPFYVSPTATQSFAIDAKSLSITANGAIRYTLVAKSESGANNISYEAIRCQSFEKKLYAFGHAEGTWIRSQRDQWEPITRSATNRQHAALAQDYFCQGKTIAGKAPDILERLRNQKTLSLQIY